MSALGLVRELSNDQLLCLAKGRKGPTDQPTDRPSVRLSVRLHPQPLGSLFLIYGAAFRGRPLIFKPRAARQTALSLLPLLPSVANLKT